MSIIQKKRMNIFEKTKIEIFSRRQANHSVFTPKSYNKYLGSMIFNLCRVSFDSKIREKQQQQEIGKRRLRQTIETN